MTERELIALIPFVAAGAAAALLSLPLVEGIRRWTLRRSLIDIPNERSSHTVPTPRGGGIAISGITLLGLAAAAAMWHFNVPRTLSWMAAALVIATVSLFDDIHSLGAATRLTAHIAAAGLVIAGCGWWRSVAIGDLTISVGIGGTALTIFWIVGVTNAYNFMDGIDGIAGVQALAASAGWMTIGWMIGSAPIAIVAALIGGSSCAFLTRNWPPAHIFMGDVGSAFLGFAFATMPFLGGGQAPRLAFPAMLLMWPFLFDTTLTLIRRIRRRENLLHAHRSHLYQRLNIAGYPHRFVTMLYGVWALFTAALAAAIVNLDTAAIFAAVAAATAAGLAVWRFVLQAERRKALSSAAAAPIHPHASL